MNTFWLKIAGIALVVAAAIVLISVFSSSEKSPSAAEQKVQPKAKQRTFYDQVEKDKKELLAKPQPVKKQTKEQKKRSTENQTSAKPARPSAEPITLYFKPLSEIEKVEAERLLNVAVPGRSIGRLPMTGFNLMVKSCRQIISKWPDSWYAYKAKQMLADMPERFRPRYKITAQELDISEFTKPRPGAEPFTIKDSR